VVLLVDPVTPPVDPLLLGLELLELESELLGVELELPELDPLPVLGPPIELVLPLLPVSEPVLGLVPAVLLEPVPLVEGGVVVLLEELVEPGAPADPVVARFSQALSERAATTATVAAAH
jgi:hypothetical protein